MSHTPIEPSIKIPREIMTKYIEMTDRKMRERLSFDDLGNGLRIMVDFHIPKKRAVFTLTGMEMIDHYITIQGSIGAGKSTLLAAIRRYVERNQLSATDPTHLATASETKRDFFLLVDEPVKEWQLPKYGPDKSVSIFGAFMSNQREMGLPFQVNTFTSRLRYLEEGLNTLLPLVADESPFVCDEPLVRIRRHVISEGSMLRDNLFMETVCEHYGMEIEQDVYRQLFSLVCDEVNKREDTMIYLPVSPPVCQQRIVVRDRLEETEAGIDPAYMALLDTKHQEMTTRFASQEGRSVIRLDAFEESMSEAEIDTLTDKLMSQLLERMSK